MSLLGGVAKRVFGSSNDRVLKSSQRTVAQINALEAEFEALRDNELRAKTDEFRARLEAGENLEDVLPEAFAAVREAAKRTLGQRHYDVQLIGGIVLHEGNIAEMKTGEGKTLVATLASYLNALSGRGSHLVTVNDYLASRDSVWMGAIYEFLGLTVGCIVHGMDDDERRAAYGADITYGTNNEFGFDYLRDNMKFEREAMVQRPFNFAIVDEVDSILVDEARTPLIISGQAEDASDVYRAADRIVRMLGDGDFEKDEKQRTVTFTEDGTEKLEGILRDENLLHGENLYDTENVTIVHHMNQALRAHKIFSRDVDYLVKDDQVVIIDEFTGRMMPGRRFSEGQHQALEAKESVEVQPENQTLASITFQNYFRLYPTLSGMTGTASTESDEFREIYNLKVVEIPTHRPMVRDDQHDEVYRTEAEKFEAIVDQVADCNKRGQPILVGTVSIEKSERLAEVLKKRKIKHNVLNARYHEQEASIIAQAGQHGAVTIATNMAGRGTDIQLGGNVDMLIAQEATDAEGDVDAVAASRITDEVASQHDKVVAAGGLAVIGTERHESRRIDNQLRGRSGRQGDPGASRFYLSLEDDLMRIFGSERMDGMLRKLGLEDGEAIVHPWINKALEKAQQKVEARNFEIRKNILKYDDVMNDQRKIIYEQRLELMETDDVSDTVSDMRRETIDDLVTHHIPEKAYHEQWDAHGLQAKVGEVFGIDLSIVEWCKEEGIADEEIRNRLYDRTDRLMAEKAANFGPEIMREVEKSILLQILDQNWKEHLLSMDHLKGGIQLRAYAQRDPLNEYKTEAFSMFEKMLDQLREFTTTYLAHVEIQAEDPLHEFMQQSDANREEIHGDPLTGENEMAGGEVKMIRRSKVDAADRDPLDPATWGKVPRNSPCPCGSGKKYKQCHGRF